MHPAAIVYLCSLFCTILHTIAHALAGRVLGAGVEEISFFWGPAIARIRVGETLWIVKLVPGPAGHVKYRKDNEASNPGFYDLHPLRRVLIIASGSLALFALALACLGPAAGTQSTWHGFRQIVRGGLAPVATGVPLVRALLKLIQNSTFSTSLGVIAAKLAAFNLLPLLPLDGGQILMSLAEWRIRFSERIAFGVAYVGLLACLFLYCSWLYAFARVLLNR